MKKKSIISLFLAILLMLSSFTALISCDDSNDDEGPEMKEYSVSLKDTEGEPVANVIVTVFGEDDKQKAMSPTGDDGKAAFELESGNYTFTLSFIGEDYNYAYNEESCVFTPDILNVDLTLALKVSANDAVDLYNGHKASIIKVPGTYYVEFSKDSPAYFLYTPTERGRFKLSIDSDVEAACGYFGSPMIIYEEDISDEDNKDNGSIYMDFRKYNINSTQYLIGVTSEFEGYGHFTIERVGDLDIIPEETEWTLYPETHKVEKFTFPGGTLVNFDITDLSLQAVLNEEDGFYHLGSADGPVIYMKLTVPTPYTEALEKICETQHFGHYVYDENGDYQYKITYASMMLKYFEAADETAGVYPLTADLAYAIQDMGDYLGWFDPAPQGQEHVLFGSEVVTLNAWLFACCYVA